MLLRFDIAITETTKTCPTAVLFSLGIRWVRTQKHVWTNSICVASPMSSCSVHRIVASKHWKCKTNGICPNVFLWFHSTHVERKQNRGWTSLRCLGNCNVKTQQHLDKFQMLTPSNVLELHLSTISCRLIETAWNHRKRKANRNCPNGVFNMWTQFSMCQQKNEFKGFGFPEEPEQTALSNPEETARSRIVQCVLSPLKRIE